MLGINNPVVCKEYVRSMYFVRRIEIFIPILPALITQNTNFLVFLLKKKVICRKERVKAGATDSADFPGINNRSYSHSSVDPGHIHPRDAE